jgi:hypothetical protein
MSAYTKLRNKISVCIDIISSEVNFNGKQIFELAKFIKIYIISTKQSEKYLHLPRLRLRESRANREQYPLL